MKNTNEIIKSESYDVFTYRSIRRAIGYLAISLPIVLLTLSFFKFFGTNPQRSISHYYYTNLREIFTGTLLAVGLFLISYRGHSNPSFWKNDRLLTNIAGAMAIGVAFIPTAQDLKPNADLACPEKIHTLIPFTLEALHYAFAGILFFISDLLAINVFTIGQENETNIPKSIIDENNIYRFCGYSILLFLVLVPISAHYGFFHYSTLVLEALSLFVFGAAWLIKGRALGDKGLLGQKLYRENNTEKVLEE